MSKAASGISRLELRSSIIAHFTIKLIYCVKKRNVLRNDLCFPFNSCSLPLCVSPLDSTVGHFGRHRATRYPQLARNLCRRECYKWGRQRSINVSSNWCARAQASIPSTITWCLRPPSSARRKINDPFSFSLPVLRPPILDRPAACSGDVKMERRSSFATRAETSNVMNLII